MKVEERFVNEGMLKRIEKIEDQMVGNKNWQMQGEILAKERPANSLLQEHLDFQITSKLPPTITKEITKGIEGMIKQRILDEVFDDPVRKELKEKKKDDDEDVLGFNKPKRGLADEYEDDFRKKMLEKDPNAYLGNEFSGTDSGIKKEVDELMRNLFY